ncbi:hypothetical protein GE09DRAFT_1222980 [Coniochaeta sp. 2T2.1]|nr:hypothetical protein GE09DRAFT_1222980 [Coniochaeta sp. 2T2.1]
MPADEQYGDDAMDSDISMSSDSDNDSDSDGSSDSDIAEQTAENARQPSANGTENMPSGVDAASKKRKSPGTDSPDSEDDDELSTPETHKKARLDDGSDKSSVNNGQVLDKSLLAPEEIDVLLSSTVPSTLIPALPFVHITKELHAVSLSTIEQGQLPPSVQATKLFLASDVQEIKQEFISVKTLGSGTVEEWLKGLEARGQERINEFRKWEKWANTGALKQVQRVTDPYASSNGPNAGVPASAATPARTADQQRTPPAARQERTLQEVAGLKAARRAEIERRASLLSPPLTPNVLRHMVSFQAAIQLITPLDDSTWKLLMPRLLAERSDAEKTENQVSAEIRSMQGQDRPSHIEATLATTKEAKDAVDKEWEEVQAPLRARIVRYVDEIIRNSWDKGKKVKADNCTKFAADALIHIRKRFYAHVAKEAKAAIAAGIQPVVDPPEGPFTQKLTLENMRWIFDTKIKPITFPLRKEVFFCNGCAAKPFGFEGVIQHYAAKHTDKLSLGNIVVHWRAEWPEEPPFNPEGRSKVVFSTLDQAAPPSVSASLPQHPYSSFAPPPSITSTGTLFPPGPGPTPAYGAQPYGEQQYPYQYPGYPPNPSYGPPAQGHPPQSYAPPPGWPPYQNGPAPNGPYPPNPTPPQVGGYQPPMAPGSAPVPPPAATPGPYNYGAAGYPVSAPSGAPAFPATQAPYTVQLDDIVRNSREIWNTIYNVNPIPGSVRAFVTIHHIVKRFRSRFSQTPSLAIFQDGLSNHKDMRPVRNVNSLMCKACKLGLGNAAYVQEDRASFSLPQLVNHFQSKHVETMQKEAPHLPPLDWTVDMIMLPPPDVLAQLPTTVRLEGFKYKLFSEALPEAFGQAPAAPVPSYYGQPPQQQHPQQHPQQPATYQPQPQYPVPAPPPAVEDHPQYYPQQQGPPQTQGQPGVEVQASYQPPNNYSQTPTMNSYLPTTAPAQVPTSAPAYQQQHTPANPMPSTVADNGASRRNDDSNHSSQSQPPHYQAKKPKRKEKKKQAYAWKRQSDSGPGSKKTKDEEPKLPDEEKAREEEMRAMWANDRAATARVLGGPAAAKQNEAATKDQGQPQVAAKPAKAERRETGPPQNDGVRKEEPSLLDALEMHLHQGHRPATQSHQPARSQPGPARVRASDARPAVASEPTRRPAEHHPGPSTTQGNRPLSPLAPYHQRAREEASQPQQRAPDQRPYDQPYPQQPAPSRHAPDEQRYDPRDQPPPGPQYRDAPPPVHRSDEPPYDRAYRPETEVMYERAPPSQEKGLAHDYGPRSSFPEDLLPPPPRGAPTGQLYEIVEYIDEQGSYFVRRPIDRVPQPEPVYYDYPYEPERPRERPPPVGADRGGPDPYAPRPAAEESYSRPPHPRGDEDYGRPPPQQHQAPPPPPQGQYRGDDYAQPGPAAGPRAWDNDYAPPQQYQQRPVERQPEPVARGGYEEEYDPRHPAAPPPGQPAEAPKYQRRQVRYD